MKSPRFSTTAFVPMAVLIGGLGMAGVIATATAIAQEAKKEPAKESVEPGKSPTLESGSVLAVSTTDESADAVLKRQRKSGAGVTNLPPRSVVSHGGAIPYVVRERKFTKIVQLLNPFAPASLGTGGAMYYEWNPVVNPGAGPGSGPLPRVFRDERTTEPAGIQLIGTSR